MSEDEGTNPAAQDVQSEEEDVADEPSPDAQSSDTPSSDAQDTPERGPETSEDVREVLDRVTEYDDELAREVNSIAETAQDLHGTAEAQREELEDLRERIDEQAETIGDLQDQLEARERELADRESDLEETRERVEELEGALKRKQADFQNYKKRAKKRQEQLKERATEDLVTRLVGVRDNLKRALDEESNDVDSLREGLEMTLREFDRILDDENVEEIDPDPGTDVDPQRHEVMMTVDSALPEGTVDDVFTPGYEMAEKVIQNAQVTVSNGDLEEPEDADGDDSPETATEESDASGEDSENGGEAIELGGEVATDEDEPSSDDEGESTSADGDHDASDRST